MHLKIPVLEHQIAGSGNWDLTLAGNAVKKKQNGNGIIDAACCFATS
jgi:hypothetical protein